MYQVQAEIDKRKRELAERRIDIRNARAEYEKEIVSEFENGSVIAEEKSVTGFAHLFAYC